jgi:hypothetical protein
MADYPALRAASTQQEMPRCIVSVEMKNDIRCGMSFLFGPT